jgi:hypothetical protein
MINKYHNKINNNIKIWFILNLLFKIHNKILLSWLLIQSSQQKINLLGNHLIKFLLFSIKNLDVTVKNLKNLMHAKMLSGGSNCLIKESLTMKRINSCTSIYYASLKKVEVSIRLKEIFPEHSLTMITSIMALMANNNYLEYYKHFQNTINLLDTCKEWIS